MVPGAGLGRLAHEFARLGFESQGNEFAYHMLIASNFILNHCHSANMLTFYPFVQQTCNNLTNEDSLRPISIPDIDPSDLPAGSKFSMCAGDFLDVYRDSHGEWDAVAACFFLDTAHNILAYLELIVSMDLRGGGGEV